MIGKSQNSINLKGDAEVPHSFLQKRNMKSLQQSIQYELIELIHQRNELIYVPNVMDNQQELIWF